MIASITLHIIAQNVVQLYSPFFLLALYS